MLISSHDLQKQIKDKWPKIEHVWLTDREYWLPQIDSVRHFVAMQPARNNTWRKYRCECEEFSLFLHAELKQTLVTKAEEFESSGNPIPDHLKYTWAFGEAIGLNFSNGQPGPHKLNIVVTEAGIHLVEPQTYQIWMPSNSRIKRDNMPDFLFYVTM